MENPEKEKYRYDTDTVWYLVETLTSGQEIATAAYTSEEAALFSAKSLNVAGAASYLGHISPAAYLYLLDCLDRIERLERGIDPPLAPRANDDDDF